MRRREYLCLSNNNNSAPLPWLSVSRFPGQTLRELYIYSKQSYTFIGQLYLSKAEFFLKNLLLTPSLWWFGNIAGLSGGPPIPTLTPSVAKLFPECTDHRSQCKPQSNLRVSSLRPPRSPAFSQLGHNCSPNTLSFLPLGRFQDVLGHTSWIRDWILPALLSILWD